MDIGKIGRDEEMRDYLISSYILLSSTVLSYPILI